MKNRHTVRRLKAHAQMIIQLYEQGETLEAIANKHNVTKQAVWRLITEAKKAAAHPLGMLAKRTRNALDRANIRSIEALREAVAKNTIRPDTTRGVGMVGWGEIMDLLHGKEQP